MIGRLKIHMVYFLCSWGEFFFTWSRTRTKLIYRYVQEGVEAKYIYQTYPGAALSAGEVTVVVCCFYKTYKIKNKCYIQIKVLQGKSIYFRIYNIQRASNCHSQARNVNNTVVCFIWQFWSEWMICPFFPVPLS